MIRYDMIRYDKIHLTAIG